MLHKGKNSPKKRKKTSLSTKMIPVARHLEIFLCHLAVVQRSLLGHQHTKNMVIA